MRVGGGGGDGPETPIDALDHARKMKYRSGTQKYIILLTDAKYKNGTAEDPSVSLEEERNELLKAGISVSVVTKPSLFDLYAGLATDSQGVTADTSKNFFSEMQMLAASMSTKNRGCWIRLANGTSVKLEKDPAKANDTIDSDKDGIPDIIELNKLGIIRSYDNKRKRFVETKAWFYYSNPSLKDTDGDTIGDIDDLRPTRYDTVVVSENDNHIKFNTGRTWHIITCNSYDYLDNVSQVIDGKVDNPIPGKKLKVISENVGKNRKQKFTTEELSYIGVINNEGSKLYMHNCSAFCRESVFQNICQHKSDKYRHTGTFRNEKWTKVSSKTKSSFWKGKVLSEADLNFSCKSYTICDIYTTLTAVVKAGAVIIALIVTAYVTAYVAPVVAANLEALEYYVSTYGVKQGLNMYCYLGVKNVPDGVITWLQMDMEDGQSSIDDLVDASIPIYKRGISGEEALQKAHPDGVVHKYFPTIINGKKSARFVDVYVANGQVAYESKVGYTCLSQRIRTQVLKDAYLLKQGQEVKKVVWVFYKSDATGRRGATPSLLEFLTEHGILYEYADK